MANVRYKDKVERTLHGRGYKSMLGSQHKRKNISLPGKSDAELADEVNKSFIRFQLHDFNAELSAYGNRAPDDSFSVQMDEGQVLKYI